MFNTKLVGKPPQFMCLPVSRQRQWYQLRWRALSKRGRTVGGLHTTAKLADGCDLPSRFKGSMTLREAAAASCIRVSIAGFRFRVPSLARSLAATGSAPCFRVRTSQCRADGAFQLANRCPCGRQRARRAGSRRCRAAGGPSSMIITSAPGAARLVLDRACQRPRVAFRAELRLRASPRPARGRKGPGHCQRHLPVRAPLSIHRGSSCPNRYRR